MRTKTVAVAVVATLVLSSLISTVSADAGDLDTSFDLDGRVITAFGATPSYIKGIAIQADGSIVTVGSGFVTPCCTSSEWSDFIIVRHKPDGAVDHSFGTGGKVVTGFDPYHASVANTVAIQPDGRIVVAGWATEQPTANVQRFALARYNTDGSLDTHFGAGGKVVTPFTGNDVIQGLVIQPNGRIVAVGRSRFSPTQNLVVLRYNQNGSLDTSFGAGGIFEIDFVYFDTGADVTVQPDGRILVAGTTGDAEDLYSFLLLRLNADGSLDTSFGTGGTVRTAISGLSSQAASIVLLSNGRILLSGQVASNIGLARYNSDGSLDASFGAGGTRLVSFDTPITCTYGGMKVLANGKIFVGGTTNISNKDFALARLNSDGAADTGFGTDGIVLTDFGGLDNGYAIAIYGNERVVMAGNNQATSSSQLNVALARHLGDGAPQASDLSVEMAGSLTTDATGRKYITYTITVSTAGPDPSYYVTLKDSIPANTTFHSLSAPQGWVVYSKPAVGHTGTVSVSSSRLGVPLPPFSSPATFTLVVRVNPGAPSTTIKNTATVSSSFTPDLYTDNNRATAQIILL